MGLSSQVFACSKMYSKDQISIGFEDLKIDCIIGILPHERKTQQPLYIDMCCILKEGFLDYRECADICQKVSQKNHFLLEDFAINVFEEIVNLKKIYFVRIKIKKPQAIQEAKHAYVIYEREFV